MKKLIVTVLSTCFIIGLFFANSATLLAANIINPYELVQGEAFDVRERATYGYLITMPQHLSGIIYRGGYIGYENVDFGDGASAITALLLSEADYTLSIKIDSLDSEPIGSMDLGVDEEFVERTIEFNEPISGVHSLYFSVNDFDTVYTSVLIDNWIAEKAPTPEPEPEPTSPLTLEYDVLCWGSGYKVDFKVVNNSDEDIVGWALKVKMNGHIVDHSWCVNIKEDGDYFIVTPLDWNSVIPANGSVEFGILSSDNNGIASEYEFIDPAPVEDEELALDYSIQSWDNGYNVNFTLTNNSDNQLNGWTLKLNKNDINITSSWSVNVEETDDYYVLTPAGWNTIIGPHGTTTFGIQGSGEIGDAIDYSLEEQR